MKTLDEQIEYIKNTLSMFTKSAVLGFSGRDEVRDTCRSILKTLEESKDATDLALERAAGVCDKMFEEKLAKAILALKSKP